MVVRAGTYISLASGGGGLDLGIDLGAGGTARPIAYVENEATAAALLVHRMETARLPAAPLWSDLRTFDFGRRRGLVDGIVGGYPCQPFSNAGKRLGTADPRHLWPFIAAGIRAVEPRWCFFENVGAHLRLGGYEVIRELQEMGYRTAAVLLTAEEVGAPHGRERLFILAQLADAERRSGGSEPRLEHQERAEVAGGSGRADDSPALEPPDSEHDHRAGNLWAAGRYESANAGRPLGHPHLAGLEGRGGALGGGRYELPAWPPAPEDHEGWARVVAAGRLDLLPATPESPVRGVADGLAGALGRPTELHILGNGVVPEQAAYAWRLLWREFGG